MIWAGSSGSKSLAGAAFHQGFVAGYAESIQTVFIVAVPIAALAFLATWLIPPVELRKWPSAESIPAAEPRTDGAPEPVTRQGMAAAVLGDGPGRVRPAA